jgi:hypothetical protein
LIFQNNDILFCFLFSHENHLNFFIILIILKFIIEWIKRILLNLFHFSIHNFMKRYKNYVNLQISYYSLHKVILCFLNNVIFQTRDWIVEYYSHFLFIPFSWKYFVDPFFCCMKTQISLIFISIRRESRESIFVESKWKNYYWKNHDHLQWRIQLRPLVRIILWDTRIDINLVRDHSHSFHRQKQKFQWIVVLKFFPRDWVNRSNFG